MTARPNIELPNSARLPIGATSALVESAVGLALLTPTVPSVEQVGPSTCGTVRPCDAERAQDLRGASFERP